jgi:peptide/nickel transport system permease protein
LQRRQRGHAGKTFRLAVGKGMSRYVLRRLLLNALVVWIVASLVFVAVRALPGDFAVTQASSRIDLTDNSAAIGQLRKELGLDKPMWQQYFYFMGDLLKGDLGKSFATRRSTWTEIKIGLPYTLELGTMIAIIAFGVAIPIGVLSAIKQDTWIDYVLRGFSILAVATPVFFSAVLILLLVVHYHLWTVDLIGRPHLWTHPVTAFKLYIIPAVAGGVAGGSGIMRLLRSQMLEVLRQDYIRTATAKGLANRRVILQHALKNAMIPVLTVMGFTVAGIISGQIILENMFNIPGLGQYLFSRLLVRDFPPFQGIVILTAVVIVSMNLIVDILYAWLDPRIRLA